MSSVKALTVAAVPTGMKIGVGISPRGVFSTPVRAWPWEARISKRKRLIGTYYSANRHRHMKKAVAGLNGVGIGPFMTSVPAREQTSMNRVDFGR